ncbi:MAG TPA: PEP/pyruvate-binding domain-containing protein, partial [Terriglobales bacterium]|nr:PEP/pyruvate-binding domain-containing protein [Terriglobales bacterium]
MTVEEVETVTNTSPRMVQLGIDPASTITAESFGGKAWGLAAMDSIGISVPPAFAINASVCREYNDNGQILPSDVPDLIRKGIAFLEQETGRVFGSDHHPLLVSVRSGAPVSMPGIMDTVLNVGLTRETVRGLTYLTGNPRFAWNTYCRLLENYATKVLSHKEAKFEWVKREAMNREQVTDDSYLDFMALRELAREYEELYTDKERTTFLNVQKQLIRATEGVLDSWTKPRAQEFRKLNPNAPAIGTAVLIQAMVFGNLGTDSGAGIGFTRNPWSGDNELTVDFRYGSQGEDVVSGDYSATTQLNLQETMPKVFSELGSVSKKLESHFRDMQDFEFTVESGKLYLLQSRRGKRSPLAALRIAVDLCNEGIVSQEEAVSLVEDLDLNKIQLERLEINAPPIGHGVSASSGVASGRIAFTSKKAELAREPGILVRETASADDVPGINAAK